jgi:transposase
MARARILLEAGTHSPWMSQLLKELGHEVIVVNPRRLEIISKSHKKTDRTDAAVLAELARTHSKLVETVQHKGPEAQHDLTVLRARSSLVAARTQMANHLRGVTKSWGGRLKKCDPAHIHQLGDSLPDDLQPLLKPVLEICRHLTAAIRGYDAEIERLAKIREVPASLHQIDGVGAQTVVAFRAIIEDPNRFKKVRQVGAYLGVVPRLDESGQSKPQLGISKAGDSYLRSQLVQCAHYIVGPFGPECDLRDWGLKLVARGGRGAKKRATVAVANKLARLLLALWKSGEVYDPYRQRRKKGIPLPDLTGEDPEVPRRRIPRILRSKAA